MKIKFSWLPSNRKFSFEILCTLLLIILKLCHIFVLSWIYVSLPLIVAAILIIIEKIIFIKQHK